MAFFETAFKERTPEQSAALGGTFEALQELSNSVPRAIAIVGCALLDTALKDALNRRFVNSSSGHKKFYEDGPGHETSDKIYLAYVLGIIGEEARENLRTIAAIRNKFAHGLHISTFGHPDLKNNIKGLTLYKKLKRESKDIIHAILPDAIPENAGPKDRFIATVGYLHALLILDPWKERSPVEKPVI